jgi:hypothetical protein
MDPVEPSNVIDCNTQIIPPGQDTVSMQRTTRLRVSDVKGAEFLTFSRYAPIRLAGAKLFVAGSAGTLVGQRCQHV